MAKEPGPQLEGSINAPTRHPIKWRDPEYRDEGALFAEMDRIFDICHGCRRCFSLCNAFPTLFDAIDDSETMELDGVDRQVYWEVVDHCYLCDMCYMSKCPYVPPHEWNVDFPHLMLRAKALRHGKGEMSTRDRLLSATDMVGKLAGIPVVSRAVNAVNRNRPARRLMEKVGRIHADAWLPEYHSKTLQKRLRGRERPRLTPVETDETRGQVALFATCYGNYNEPELGEDLVAVFEHNGIPVEAVPGTRCCAMPKLENGDLASVEQARAFNIPKLIEWLDRGYDIVAPVPSCVLMFKQELPLMFPEDGDVATVAERIFDPFQYLMLRHKAGHLKTDFKRSLGTVSYHVPCHLRVQNIGMKTRDLLKLVPDTKVLPVERCSGHDGTYAVKREFHETSMKIGRPVVNRVAKAEADHYSSDCPMAGHQIQNGLRDKSEPAHPLKLLRMAYGL